MTAEDEFLRRTWPQRLVLLAAVLVVAGALMAAWWVRTIYEGVADIGRVEIAGEVLARTSDPAEPVNFLLVGTDGTDGLDPDDPIRIGRIEDPRGRSNADTIAILRLDPVSQQAWVLPIPRDLYVPFPGKSSYRINAALLVGGPETLIATIKSVFDIDIHHYVQVDFRGFQEVIDEIGGVPVWFEHPTKSEATGLNIVEAPRCWTLDGEESLRYVRPRHDYSEFIDGRWVVTGARDFERIQRQQDFLVLALERAISRGARNPLTLTRLIKAGARSVVLDSELTPAQLSKFGESFSSFSSDNITRFGLTVTTSYDDEGVYVGELLVDGADTAALDVFRGAADAVRESDVSFDLYAANSSVLAGDSGALSEVGFDVLNERQITLDLPHSIVVYPPGRKAEAETIAGRLLPVPAIVEDVSAIRISLVLGADHEQVLFFFPNDVNDVRLEIERLGAVDIPDLGSGVVEVPTTSAGTPTTTGDPVPPSTVTTTQAPATSTTVVIMGRPPEGQSCP